MTFDLSKIHLQPASFLTLTLGTDALYASAVRASGPAPGEPVRIAVNADAVLADPAKAGAALAAALAAAHLNERHCALALPPSWVLSTSAELPEVSAEDLRGYFELRAEREFSVPDLVIAHAAYTPPEGGPARATLAALPARRMEAATRFLQTAGCHPVSISLDLPAPDPAHPEPLLHLIPREGGLDVVVSCADGIAAIRSISGSEATLFREVRITLGRLPESIRTRLGQACAWGEDAGLAALIKKLGLAAVPRAACRPGQAAKAAEAAARRVLRHESVPFEFFTPEPNRWREALQRFNTPRGRRSIAAAAAVIFLPVLAFSYRTHREASLNREWAAMKSSVAELDTMQQKIRQFRPWFEPAPQKLQALKTVVAAFPERGDLWTRSVQISPFLDKTENSRGTPSPTAAMVTINGFALNNAALMVMQGTLSKQAGVSALQLKQLRGNNPSQFSLNFKWETRHE